MFLIKPSTEVLGYFRCVPMSIPAALGGWVTFRPHIVSLVTMCSLKNLASSSLKTLGWSLATDPERKRNYYQRECLLALGADAATFLENLIHARGNGGWIREVARLFILLEECGPDRLRTALARCVANSLLAGIMLHPGAQPPGRAPDCPQTRQRPTSRPGVTDQQHAVGPPVGAQPQHHLGSSLRPARPHYSQGRLAGYTLLINSSEF